MPRKQPSAPPTASPAAPPADLFTHNQALAEVSRTLYGDNARLEVVDPRSLTLLKENARYFKKETFRQLVENVKHDRRLSSMPLCYADPASGHKVVLSGNHRVKAAIEGAVPLILVLTITEDLSRSQQIAIQLSHNALVGQDDAGILSHLWAQIEDINARLYAGLSSENMKEIEDVKLVTFSTPSVATKSLSFAFTEYERDQLDQVMEELSRIHANETYVFPAEQFQDFFQLIQNVKGKKNIKNGSMAMVKILEIVTAHLEASDELPAPGAAREPGEEV